MKYAITINDKTGRNYLISWKPNAIIEDAKGLTWTTYENFKKCNNLIAKNSSYGESTVFNSFKDAKRFAISNGIKDFWVTALL